MTLEERIYELISTGAFGENCGMIDCDREDGDCDKCLTIAIMKVIDKYTRKHRKPQKFYKVLVFDPEKEDWHKHGRFY